MDEELADFLPGWWHISGVGIEKIHGWFGCLFADLQNLYCIVADIAGFDLLDGKGGQSQMPGFLGLASAFNLALLKSAAGPRSLLSATLTVLNRNSSRHAAAMTQ